MLLLGYYLQIYKFYLCKSEHIKINFLFKIGYKMSRPSCRNRVTGSDVDESLCSGSTRPEPAVVQCNTHMCPPK